MARFSIDEADNYGSRKSSYFTLKDDKDTAVVRFLYNNLNDIRGIATHEIYVGDKRVEVECLRSYNEPVHNCPLCAEGYEVNAKLYIPVYDENAKESKIWTRGKKFFDKLSSLCSRYNPLVSMPFEIERNGKKGDTQTTYEIYPTTADKSRIEDFPEIQPEGVCFLVKTADELNYFIDNGTFPDENNTRTQARNNRQTNTRDVAAPVRRRPSYNEEDNF